MDILQFVADQAVIWSVVFVSLCVLICVLHIGGE